MLCALFLPVALSSCASVRTNFDTFKDPRFENKRFKTVLVSALLPNLKKRKQMEDLFSQELQKKADVTVYKRYKVFLPTREYSAQAYVEEINSRSIDGIIQVTKAKKSTFSTYVPNQTNCVTNSYTGQATCNSYGGYSISKPSQETQIEFLEAATGVKVWIATVSSSGNGFSGYNDIDESIAKELVENLLQDNVVIRPSEHGRALSSD